MSEPTRYPLAWPEHRPRKSWATRRAGAFKQDGSPITLARAVDRVLSEIGRLGASYPLISSNVELRRDGLPKSGARMPSDPGVCVYFTLKGKPYALACDTYTNVEQNLAAVAAHIDATRAVARHGVASAEETLQAFSALPPPTGAQQPTQRPWRVVLAFSEHFPAGLTPDEARGVLSGRFRERAKSLHVDAGGSHDAMAELTSARDAALKEIGS